MDINQDTKINLNLEQWNKLSELERSMYVNLHQEYLKQEPNFMLTEENEFEIVKTYFKHGEWHKLSESEKLRYGKTYNLYQESLLKGIVLPKPNFMTSNEENICENEIKVEETTPTIYDEYSLQVTPNILHYNACEKELKFFVGSEDLVHILDNNVQKGTKDRAKRTLPKNLLKIKESAIYGEGVFALKTISKGIKFGPYEGLENMQGTVSHAWRIMDRKLVNSMDIKFSNWMRYINSTRNIKEGNLITFQYDGCLYYRSIKTIEEGEELLVFYEEEFMEIVNGKEYFIPIVENEMEYVYACSLCCLGFSSEDYLKKHVSVCPHKLYVFISGFGQCSSCKVCFIHTVYLEKHVKYCRRSFTRNSKHLDDDLIEQDACDIDKRFEHITFEYEKNKNHLEADTQKHTEVESLKDTICKEELTQKRNVKVHLRKCGGEERLQCDSLIKKDTSDLEKRFRCSICLYQTDHCGSFKKHVDIHNGLKPFRCVICNKKFTQKGTLKQHLNIHSGERPFQCAICNKKFRSNPNLIQHSKTHSGETPFHCAICNQTFTRRDGLKQHLQIHSGEKQFQCTICNKEFKFNQSLKLHLRIHSGETPFECKICNKNFTQKSNLEQHLRIHSGEKPFQCKICNKEFTYKSSLNSHLVLHSDEKQFQCNDCQFSCKLKQNLVIHIKSKHTMEKEFHCTFCSYKCVQKGDLNNHLRTHTNEHRFQCHICNKKFTQKHGLKKHLLQHTGEKQFRCTVCDREFCTKWYLEVHLRTHTGEKPFHCTVCNKEFSTKSTLNIHLRTHTGEKPFHCTTCNKRFSTKWHLKIHLRTHTGGKPFHCAVCNEKFARKCKLKIHLRIHSGEKPFHCTTCNKKFRRKDALNKHVKLLHADVTTVVMGQQ